MSLPKSAKLCRNTELNESFNKIIFKAFQEDIISSWTYDYVKLYVFKSTRLWGLACQGTNSFDFGFERPFVCINEVFLQDPKKAIDTIVHEVAHLGYSTGHSEKWKKDFIILGSYFGVKDYGITSSESTVGLKLPRKKETPYKYALKCPKCGCLWKYKTKCKALDKKWKHRECGETLVVIKLDK